jgi:glycosyltransferase involved in cell wall biosynthesis
MKLSVVIPAFNASSTIEETVKAICNPIYYFVDEVIIYNDGSTDNTLSIIKNLKSKFLKIKYFSSTKNKGGGFARNFGIKKCKNQLIMVLDADELLHETSVQKIYKQAIKNNHTAHYATAKYFSNNFNKIDSYCNYYKAYGKNFTYNKVIKNFLTPNNFIFTKRSWVKAGKYSTNTHWDTQDFSIKFLKNVGPIKIVKGTFYYHRRFVKNYLSYYERQELSGNNFFNSYKLFELIVEDLNLKSLSFLLKRNVFLSINIIVALENYKNELSPEFFLQSKSLQSLIEIIILHKNKKFEQAKSLLKNYLINEKLYITDLILFLIIRCDQNFSNKEYNEFRKVRNFFYFVNIFKSYPNSIKLISLYFKFLIYLILKKIKKFIIK